MLGRSWGTNAMLALALAIRRLPIFATNAALLANGEAGLVEVCPVSGALFCRSSLTNQPRGIPISMVYLRICLLISMMHDMSYIG